MAPNASIRSAFQSIRGYPLNIFLICLFGLALANTDQAFFSYATPGLMGEFGVGLDAVGWILFASFICAAVCSLAVGIMADRFGRRRLFIICLAGAAVLIAGLTIAPDILTLTALRSLSFGLSAALVPLATTYTVEAAPDRLRGLLSGLLQVGYPTGWFVASIIAAPILAVWGWRYVFVPALLVVPLAFLVARVLPESTRFLQQQATQEANEGRWTDQLAILWQPPFKRRTILCSLMFFFHAGAYAGTAFYFPTYFVEVHNYTQEEATSLVGLSYLIGIFGYVGAALVGEFWLNRRDTIVIWMALGGLAFLGLIWIPESRLGHLLWFSVMTIFFYGSAAVHWAFAAEQFPTQARATATSICMAATLFGFALFPVLVAYLIEALDWRWTFTWVVFPSLVVAVIATLGMQRIKSGTSLDEIAEVGS